MSEKIMLIENDQILSNDKEIAECFNNRLINITHSLDIDRIFRVGPVEHKHLSTEQMVLKAIEKYKDDPSICKIKEKFESTEIRFNLAHVNPLEVIKQINFLDENKSNCRHIPTSLLKETKNNVCPYLTDSNNSAIFEYKFQDELREANVSSVSKADDKISNLNYRPISISPTCFLNL